MTSMMHHGNLSFIASNGRPYDLAPASLSETIDGDTWREALALAENVFAMASSCDRFSAGFAPCLEALRSHLDEAKVRISRLG